jgi:hypothetical protein
LEIQLDGFSKFGKRVLFIRVLANPGLDKIKNETEYHFVSSFGTWLKKMTGLFIRMSPLPTAT